MSESTTDSRTKEWAPRQAFWIAFGLCLIPLLGWWTIGLLDLDEGFYGAVTGEMLRRNEWVTPYYNGAPWFEKPILLYWASMIGVKLFGGEFGARLPSVAGALGLYSLLYWFGRRYINLHSGLAAMLICGTSLLMVALARMMMTDALLALSLSGCFLLFWHALHGNRWAWGAAGACLGLSILAKGPVGCILFGGVVIWTYITQSDLRISMRSWGWVWGVLAMLAIVATWYVPCYLANGDTFVQKFLIEQNINRFQGGDKAHQMPLLARPFFYPLILLLGMTPWIWRLREARQPGDSRYADVARPFLRYCWGWAGVIFVFFFMSGTQLTHYVLPCLPPLSLILAASWARTRAGETLGWGLFRGFAIASVVLCLIANIGFTLWYQGAKVDELHRLAKIAGRSDLPLVEYQMSRRTADRGTGGLKLMETSHPSILFYTGRPMEIVEDIQGLRSRPGQFLVLTRPGRLTESDLKSLGDVSREPSEGEGYEVYTVKN